MGRPVELKGRPGGGGMGRPVALRGGRVPPSPSAPPPRCVGRMVVGPLGETLRVGMGFGAATLERTTFGVLAATSDTDVAATSEDAGATASTTLVTRDTRVGAGGAGGGVGLGAGATSVAFTALVALVALTTLMAFSAFSAAGASDGTSRRSPSASARRRMRSACASSIDAEGLDAPIPSFWASASNSLLVRPSSLESSCTRIFFGAKTIPYFVCPHIRRTQFPILSQLRPFPRRKTSYCR